MPHAHTHLLLLKLDAFQANGDLLMSANDTAGTVTARTGPRTEKPHA